MNRMGTILGGVALVALSACGKGDTGASGGSTTGPQSVEQVAEQVKKVKLEPGQWEFTHEVVEAKFENAPKGMPPGMMQNVIGKKRTYKHCITPEEAENPGKQMMPDEKTGKCKYANFDMSNGLISGAMTCTGEQGEGSMTMKMTGSFTSDSYDTTVDMTTAGMGNMTMHMIAKGSGKRVGECTTADKE